MWNLLPRDGNGPDWVGLGKFRIPHKIFWAKKLAALSYSYKTCAQIQPNELWADLRVSLGHFNYVQDLSRTIIQNCYIYVDFNILLMNRILCFVLMSIFSTLLLGISNQLLEWKYSTDTLNTYLQQNNANMHMYITIQNINMLILR